MSIPLNFPTEVISLPSKGILYPKTSPLSSGKVEMKYMTAREEDILTNINYIQNGTLIDKLLEALIVTKEVDIKDLLEADKDALLISARILGYGKDYKVTYLGQDYMVDLSELKEKQIDESLFSKQVNRFNFTLPVSGIELEFKLLNGHDESAINAEVQGLQKLGEVSERLVRLKKQILSINGDSSRQTIDSFVDDFFLASDARAFRKYLNQIEPGLDLNFYPKDGPEGGVSIPIGATFLWPDL